MATTYSPALRRIQESFANRPPAPFSAPATTYSTNIQTGAAAGPSSGESLEEFEKKVNAPDYPEELRTAYFSSKSKGEYTEFNNAIEKYNAAQQAKAAEFEKTINAPDYPESLRKAYNESKQKGDLSGFNEAVTKYNAEQKAEFEKQLYEQREVKSDNMGNQVITPATGQTYSTIAQPTEKFKEDIKKEYVYPAEFREAYEQGGIEGFNKAVQTYNARIKKEQENYILGQQMAAATAGAYLGAMAGGSIPIPAGYAIGPSGLTLAGVTKSQVADEYGLTTAEIERLGNLIKENPKAPELKTVEDPGNSLFKIASATGASENQVNKLFNTLFEPVGINAQGKPEYVLKTEFEKIKAESPAYAEVLKKQGIEAYSQTVGNKGQTWLANNIKTDPYLSNILATKGEEAAIEALNKRNADLKAVYDRWVVKNVKSDDYLNNILKTKGERAAIAAYNKRVGDLGGIYERQFTKWINTEAPQDLRDAYKQGGAVFDTAFKKYTGEYNEAMANVQPYIKREWDIQTTSGTRDDVTDTSTRQQAANRLKLNEPTIDIVSYLRDDKDKKYLKTLGVTDQDILDAYKFIAYEQGQNKYVLDYFKDHGWKTEMPSINPANPASEKELADFQKHVKEANSAYFELLPENKPLNIAKEAALGMIPVYGTWRYYQQAKEGGLDTREKINLGLGVLFDFATVIPIAGQVSAAARGTFMGAKAGQYISRGVQLREFGKAAGGIALAEIKAPFTVIAHPIETLKAGLSPLETLTRWQVALGGKNLIKAKIPLSAAESKWNTMRIPFSMVGGDEKTALQLRDKVTGALVRGESNQATVNGWTVDLNPAAINRLGEPLAVSATPDVRPFLNGAEIGKGMPVELADGRTVIMGEGRDLFLAPTLHSRFAEATSNGMIPKDPIPGAIILRGDDLIKNLESSGKSYAGTAEIESIISAKKKLNLGKPVQTLITRTSYGKKLTLLVYGKPFTQSEIAGLKFMGSADTLAQIFRQPVKINGKAVNELTDLNQYTDLVNQQAALKSKLKELKTGAKSKTSGMAKELDQLENELSAALKEKSTLEKQIESLGKIGDVKSVKIKKSKLDELDNKVSVLKEKQALLKGNTGATSNIGKVEAELSKVNARLKARYGKEMANSEGYRLPIRTVMANYNSVSLFDNYRALTGDTRKDIVIRDEREERELTEAERRAPRLKVQVRPAPRLVPGSKERRGAEMSKRRFPVDDTRRKLEKFERRATPPGNRRAQVIPPNRRMPLDTTKRIPATPPDRRMPPNPPTRLPPNPPDRRMPPNPPDTRLPPRPPKLKGSASGTEKRKEIAGAKIAIAYRRGALEADGTPGLEDVWHVYYMNSGKEWFHSVLVGSQPEGAEIVRGPKSAEKTLQRYADWKKLPAINIINTSTGVIQDRLILGQGKPRLESITGRARLPHSKMPRITERTPSITGKTPRLKE